MARTFIVFIEIALLVMVLRTSVVQYFFLDVQDSLSNWLIEVSQIAEKRELSELRENFSSNVSNFTEYQHEYIQDITANKASLSRFHQFYCVKKDKNPFVYGTNLQTLCTEIQRTHLLNR